MRKAVFLDKDGTLIPDIPFNADPALITLNPGVGNGLKLLQDLEYELFIVSNQSGIALGYFKEEDLLGINEKIIELLTPWKIKINGFYYCPHHPEGIVDRFKIVCNCRKPLSGLIEKAINENNIEVSKSWMIGDILNDVEAGNRAGCKSILIDNGNETEWVKGDFRQPDFIANIFIDAATYIGTVTE